MAGCLWRLQWQYGGQHRQQLVGSVGFCIGINRAAHILLLLIIFFFKLVVFCLILVCFPLRLIPAHDRSRANALAYGRRRHGSGDRVRD